MESTLPPHIESIIANMNEVKRLSAIHSDIGGSGPGRKHNIEVLNRSAIVLIVACWESYIEDLACIAFDYLLTNAKQPHHIPSKVLTTASKDLKENKDESKVWELAGDGWRKVLKRHRKSVLDRYVGKLNTPRPKQIDDLYETLLGMKNVSKAWAWKGTTNKRALERLDNLITLRGEIAHRVVAGNSVHKKHVDQARHLIGFLSAVLSNQVAEHLSDIFGVFPYGPIEYVKD